MLHGHSADAVLGLLRWWHIGPCTPAFHMSDTRNMLLRPLSEKSENGTMRFPVENSGLESNLLAFVTYVTIPNPYMVTYQNYYNVVTPTYGRSEK